VLSNADTARSASIASVATAASANSLAAGSIIQQGILRSMPSDPRTVIGICAWRDARTTSSSAPASGWNG
jgi:hypothetical protein